MKNLILFLFSLLIWVPIKAQSYLVPVYTVSSLQTPEPGEEPYKTIDGDVNTMYHSDWNANAIPDELKFYFTAQAQSIKKIVYSPRQSGYNGIWTNVDVLYATQTQPTNFISISANLSWTADNQDKVITLPIALADVAVIKFVINAAVGNFSSCAEMQFFSDDPFVANNVDCTAPTGTLTLNGANDIKINIQTNNTTASSYQPGENIEKSFDNDLNSLYHSSYNNTIFPVTLNYRFDGTSAIDYLKYIPRNDGGYNGNFGEVLIQYNTLVNPTFQTLLTYDFAMSALPVIVNFPNTITPYNIQIVVQSGYNNFASCAEMEFYKQNPSAAMTPPTGIFSDSLCSELLPGVSQSQITAIVSPFYKELAQCLYNQSYNHKYRVQEFEVYWPTQKISQDMKVGGYDPYENPTGIAFNANDTIALFAENLPTGTPVYLCIKDFAVSLYGAQSFYLLKNGLNVFKVDNSGLGYISYFHLNLALPNVKLNIVSGKINGYYDKVASQLSEWPELLENTNYPKIDVRGEFAHLVFDRNALKAECPFEAFDLIDKYDEIIKHERVLMGWFKYNISPKNHQLAYTESGGGWYAGGLGIHLDLDWGVSSITNPNQLDVWGIPHEFGHVNQMHPDLNWIGTTEVTNNIYSVWVQYKMNSQGDSFTRLESGVDQAAPNIPAAAGGTINGAINATYVNGKALQQDTLYDVFKILVPFWQLELYYQIAGACKNAPELSFQYPGTYTGIDYARWYGTVSELSRNTNSSNLTNGELLLNFVKNTCDAVEEDLTNFFINTGFLKPVDVTIDDYGIGQLTVTQSQINQTMAYIQSKNYPTPVSPVMNYISAHSVNVFKNQLPLAGTTGIGVSLNGTTLLVQNSLWPNAVAFEVYDTLDTLMHVCIVGTGNTAMQTTTIYYPANAHKVYAVGFDGQKILVYPNLTSLKNTEKNVALSVYPNPLNTGQYLHLSGIENNQIYEAVLYSLTGTEQMLYSGNKTQIERKLNEQLVHLYPGMYFLDLKNNSGERYTVKITKAL